MCKRVLEPVVSKRRDSKSPLRRQKLVFMIRVLDTEGTPERERETNIKEKIDFTLVKDKGEMKAYQPQRPASRYLHCEEELVVRHVQNYLILGDQDVTAAVRVGTEGGVGLA